jgi:hypothetical protein
MPGILSGLLGMFHSHESTDRSIATGLAARRSSTSRKLWRAAAHNYVRMPRVKGGTITRQRRRAAARAAAFASITEQYPGEPRAARRRMARAIANREWRAFAAGAR